MALKDMYEGVVNSPETTITTAINATVTNIVVSDGEVIPAGVNLLTLGGDTLEPETVKLTGKVGNSLTVQRGFQGVAKAWPIDTKIARNFTEYDHNAFINNINDLYDVKADSSNLLTLANNLTEEVAGKALEMLTQGRLLNDDLVAHKAEKASQGEIHGLRVENNKLEFYTGTEWKIASGGIPVGNVSGLSAEEDDAEITLMWADPEDRYLDDLKIAEWQGTKIVRKQGSYPISEDDGMLVVDNKNRNQYSTNGYKDTGLTNDVEYFYMAFPYTEEVPTVDGANRVSATPTETDPNSWAGIQKIVRKGITNDFFSVGDQLMSNYDSGQITWEIIGIDIDIPADSSLTHSMTLQTKDCLHDIQFDAPEPSNPDSNRKSYGNNRYTHSAIKQWLNSDEVKFNWQSQHQYDAKPTSTLDLYNGAGFLNRLDPELVAVLGGAKKKVAKNTATDGGGQEEFTDKIFLLSQKEVDLGDEGVNTGEFVYPFYQGKGNANRIKNFNNSARYWWLRSPNVSHSINVRRVDSGGSLNYNYAISSYGLSPACVIV